MSNQELAPNGKEKVQVELVGQDGNSFSILARCRTAMERAGWSKEEVFDFTKKAMSGDRDNLLRTVMEYCEDGSEDEEEEQYNFYADEEDEEE